MKVGANCEGFRLALIGTSSDAGRLVLADEGSNRFLTEVRLYPMISTEARKLIADRMAALGIEVPDTVVDRVIAAAAGGPAIIHYRCLEIAEAAFVREPRRASDEDFDAALNDYVEGRAARLNERYLAAIETTGPKRYRRLILRAMAALPDDLVNVEQRCTKTTELFGEDVPATALSGPLRALKDDDRFGGLLADFKARSADRVYNYTRFADPSMKAFIRMRLRLDEGE